MVAWIKKNLTISVIITLLFGYGCGAAFAAVLKSDVERLKDQMKGLPEGLARVESKQDIMLDMLRDSR